MNGSALQDCGCASETWDCGDGAIDVPVDSRGCPISPKYCKIQAGATALAVLAGAAFTLTIAVTNLTKAKIRSLVLECSDPLAPLAAREGTSLLAQVGVTGVAILGAQMLSGEVPGTRYKNNTTGPGGKGIQQAYRGTLGTANGTVVVTGINRSSVTVNIWGACDVDGVKDI